MKYNNTVAETVAEQIKEYLFAGEIKKGEKLPGEINFAKRLGVGRSSVREALRLLDASGYIEIIPNRGAFAVITDKDELPMMRDDAAKWLNVNKDSIAELLDMRAYIEPCAAKLAATRISDEALGKLRNTLDLFETCADSGDYARLSEIEYEFHGAILNASGNRFLIRMYNGILQLFMQYSARSNAAMNTKALTLSEHRLIYEALEAHNPDEAEAAMRLHIEISRRRSNIIANN